MNLLGKLTACLHLCVACAAVLALTETMTFAQPTSARDGDSAAVVGTEEAAASLGRPRLEWRFRRVHWAEITTAAVAGVTAFAVSRIDTPTPRWTRVNAFDGWVRSGLRLSGRSRDRVDLTSDVFAITLIAFPFAVDLVGVALVGDRNKEVFGQLTLIQAQAFAWSSLLTYGTKVTARRQRPFAGDLDCPDAPDCSGGANQSFFSGHTATAFTGAALTCVAHLHLPLYGRVGDPLACASTLTLATLTGLFRVMADEHWATDVVLGAGVGLFSGWLMPWLLHFRHEQRRRDGKAARSLRYLAPYGSPNELGLRINGRF